MQIRDRIRELRRVRASELVPNPNNWRLHSQAQAAALGGLLAEIGYADALLARELADGRLMLIDGHLRAATTPSQEVPVLILDVTEQDAEKIMLTLDPLAAMAGADAGRLQALLESVQFESEGVTALLEQIAGQNGLGALQSEAVFQDGVPISKAAELQQKWGTALGQRWKAGPHRLSCGDCRDPDAVRWLWAKSERLRMIWTDPPYGVAYADKNAYLNRSDRGNRIQVPIANDHLTADETARMFQQALALARGFAQPAAACYATVPSGPLLFNFYQAFNASGFQLHAILLWLKQHFVLGLADYQHRYEFVLYGWLPGAAHYFTQDRRQADIFEVDKPAVSDLHPTTKPVELIARMVANSSKPGDIIYDPFCGSGSTLVAAHQLGRVGYGIEIDPGYAAVTLERLAALGAQPQRLK
jgi:DNA modification methylase